MSATTDTGIDWEAVEVAAARCGARTRALVASRDLDELRPWVLMLSRQHSGPAAATYFEVAVLVGAIPPLPARVWADSDHEEPEHGGIEDEEPEDEDLDDDEDDE